MCYTTLSSLFFLRMAGRSAYLRDITADPESKKWVDFGLNSVCSAVGVSVAFYMDQVVYTVSNAMVGSEIMADQVVQFLEAALDTKCQNTTISTILKWGFMATGCYHQLVMRKGELPPFLKGLLFVPLLGEKTLRATAAVLRSGGFAGIVP
mmetsp:Transcript_23035/g.67041  ORF Transcript_23035/g.67041 Transcript_23035/m.67041 type:complete len:151 (+) Transcript_23035:730-1182(+)